MAGFCDGRGSCYDNVVIYIGIDYGQKRIGIAISDDEVKIAFPRTTVENKGNNKLVKTIASLVKKEQISCMVVGLPVGLQGQETKQTKGVRAFANKLRKVVSVPVEFENEMLTTKMAKESGAKDIDASSAAIMLQSYLDKKLKTQKANLKTTAQK